MTGDGSPAMLGQSVFSAAVKGTCLYCHAPETIIRAADCESLPAEGLLGVCDVCSFALSHAWNRAMGRVSVATTPRFARTYVLVPRLPEGRPVEDISSYQCLAAPDGFLPWFDHGADARMVPELLEREYGCKTWVETLRRCYLGFASGGDFSEVLVAWAWGKSLGVKDVSRSWKTFADLLAIPTPDAGFHLGICAGFESLLWRREVQPEGNELCVYMPPRAMKYLRHQDLLEERAATVAGDEPGKDEDDEDDKATIEFYKSSMTSSELLVVSLLEEARRQRAEEAAASEEVLPESDDGEAGSSEVPSVNPKIIPPGFARSGTIVER